MPGSNYMIFLSLTIVTVSDRTVTVLETLASHLGWMTGKTYMYDPDQSRHVLFQD